MSLPKYFECHNCHKVFKQSPYQNGKFCNRQCYTDARNKFTREELANLIPIPRDAPSTTTTPLPVNENVVNARIVEVEPKPQQNASTDVPSDVRIPVTESDDGNFVINFEDLSLNEIKEIISSLLDHVEFLEEQIKKKRSTPLQSLVMEFAEKIISIQNSPACPACEKNFTPAYEGQVFCSDACAESVLKCGIMRMEDGRFLWNRKVKA